MKTRTKHRSIALGLSILCAASVQGQWFSSYEIPPPYRTTKPGIYAPLIADVIEQTTCRTPWGTFTQTLKGKFWRTREGNYRQDRSYGETFIFKQPNQIWLDHVSKTATISISILDAHPPGTMWLGNPKVGAPQYRRGKVGDRELIGSPEDSVGKLNLSEERWWDLHWGVLMHHNFKTSSTDYAEQLINVEERDPDPSLFQVPEGYRVITCIPSKGVKLPAECPEGLPSKPR